jgi:hypothetical protein
VRKQNASAKTRKAGAVTGGLRRGLFDFASMLIRQILQKFTRMAKGSLFLRTKEKTRIPDIVPSE